MKFLELHERLRLETWRRIDLGILSGALLAQKSGLAQAHISNFLHRRRRLSLPALDRILLAEALSVEELSSSGISELPPPEGIKSESMDIVPVVSQSTAMATPIISANAKSDLLQLPKGWLASFPARRALSRRKWDRFVAVRVTAEQARPMDPLLRAGSVVVLDRHYNSLAVWSASHPNLYGVRAGSQMAFRHVTFEASRLILRPRALEFPIEVVELADQETPSDLLVGRICLCISQR